jgi:hypothetical protein
MTDHDGHRSAPDGPTDDELVAAVLDGEATPAERARVENDPHLLERLAQFRAVAEQIGRPVGVEPERLESVVAAALDEFTTGPGAEAGSEAGAADEAVTLLPRRERPARALAPWLAAAAALLVLVPLGWALTRDDGARDEPTAMTTETDRGTGTAVDELTGGPDTDEAERSAADQRQSGPAAGTMVDLGPIDSLDQLRALLEPRLADDDAAVFSAPEALPDSADATTSPHAGPTACEAAVRRGDSSLGALVLVGTATYRGAEALVYVFTEPGTLPRDGDDPAPHVVVVAADPGCNVVERASR